MNLTNHYGSLNRHYCREYVTQPYTRDIYDPYMTIEITNSNCILLTPKKNQNPYHVRTHKLEFSRTPKMHLLIKHIIFVFFCRMRFQ